MDVLSWVTGWMGAVARLNKQRKSWACDVGILWEALSVTNTSMVPTEHGRSKQFSKQIYWHILNNRIYERKKYPWYCEMNEPLDWKRLIVLYIMSLTGTMSSIIERGEQVCVPKIWHLLTQICAANVEKETGVKCTAECVFTPRGMSQ
jgi:hypothetical protein